MKNDKKELKGTLLTKVQSDTVKDMIVGSMRDAYSRSGMVASAGLDAAAAEIADKIIKNTQMALIQNTVFAKAVDNSKPLKIEIKKKNNMSIKKVIKKAAAGKKKITKKSK